MAGGMVVGECYIFCAGDYFGLVHPPEAGDLVIAADGGYKLCQKEGLNPVLVIGDFDSLGQPPDHPNVVVLPVDKDDTDLMAALRQGLRWGCRVFHIYGAVGGDRPDHTLAAYQCLLFLASQGCRGYLYGSGSVITAIKDGKLTLPAAEAGVVSVFTMSGPAEGVTLKGLHFPLKNARLEPDVPLGVSNRFCGKPVEISVRQGALLIFWDQPQR